jgi:putative methionine-R-sulfoxide reductase with GAF domain
LTQQLTSSPRKKLLDEGSFQELLAAAYVLQQHQHVADNPSANSAEVFSEIVRIQRSIRGGKLSLVATAKLISQQLQRFTQADGVAIGILSGNELIYLAAVGTASHDIGRRLPLESSLPAPCLRTGLTFQSSCTHDDPRMVFALFDQSDVKSFIAVPVEYENKVVGVLEARFRSPKAFRDDDVRTCELMAVLVKEVIARAGQPQAAQEVELEREPEPPPVALSEELIGIGEAEIVVSDFTDEKHEIPGIAPALPHQLSKPPRILPVAEAEEVVTAPVIRSGAEPVSLDLTLCRGCGQHLAEDELYCGKCGTERIIRPDSPLQSKWASLWYMNQARRAAEEQEDESLAAAQEAAAISKPQGLSKPGALDLAKPKRATLESIGSATEEIEKAPATEHAKPLVRLEWLPDITASESETWLRHQWRVNRANFYLAGAALVLLVVLSGLGTTPVPETTPSANASGPQLTLFERMLVGLGIAEAPQTPVYRGNPDTPVWVDLHTALYYCPGSDLYGRTDGGKIATQRSAQMDQFEPAHRKACN